VFSKEAHTEKEVEKNKKNKNERRARDEKSISSVPF
jgi:hypothetical protein